MKNKRIQEIMSCGGGISCNSGKVEEAWLKYYDFVSHYNEVTFQVSDLKEREWKKKTLLLFTSLCGDQKPGKVVMKGLAKGFSIWRQA